MGDRWFVTMLAWCYLLVVCSFIFLAVVATRNKKRSTRVPIGIPLGILTFTLLILLIPT